MPKEVLTLKRIQEIEEVERLQKKKREKKLNRIGDFYNELRIFLNEMQMDYENELKINPTSQKAIMLREQITKAKDLANNIYKMREETIVYYALSYVKGIQPREIENMTKEEKELYNSLIEIFEKTKKEVFRERVFKEEVSKIVVEDSKKEITKKTIVEEKIEKIAEEEYFVVRILEDMNFVGTDEKNYSLKKEDVVSLPIETAKVLSKRGKGIILSGEN